jgi:two-component system, LuxR family, sensor histidine kinase DctS
VTPSKQTPSSATLAHPKRRRLLWLMLVTLVAALLATLVWLAGRYEASAVQDSLERDAIEAAASIRAAMARNAQSLHALPMSGVPGHLAPAEGVALLRDRREMMRIEWRSASLALQAQVDSPYWPALHGRLGREGFRADIEQVCANARKNSTLAYSDSYFLPLDGGIGIEIMELCLPHSVDGKLAGYLVATYSLEQMLNELLAGQMAHNKEVSFTEPDGTRLALRSGGVRANRQFTTRQLVNLPGNTLVLRMSSWRGAPDLFPNVLTALVTAMSIALVSILALLAKDMRRRQKAEGDLADALAFRKAMEDSLVTGLRARDLLGRTTYVNPAFCQMVGFSAMELLDAGAPAPYWPSHLVDEYAQRQAMRLAGNMPPREGFESVFMRRDGTQFPVLIIEAPLINAQNAQTGWMSAVLDISEQKRVQEESRASQERLQATARLATVGEMASLLSHELNQPLAAIASYAAGSFNLLSTQEHTDNLSIDLRQDLAVAVRRIAEQAERAGKVIKSVNDFVRRREPMREAVSPSALLDAVLPLVTLQARKLSVQVETQVAADLPLAVCDCTLIEQVLLNLARNAMQSMDSPTVKNRVLAIAVAKRADRGTLPRLVFSVADRGLGISDDVRPKLFTPFFTTKTEGMGLGLSLCRTVVEQHGGMLEFEPNQPDGTVFRFTLPVAPAQ